jgi:xanthine dehydrogenase accessory factor
LSLLNIIDKAVADGCPVALCTIVQTKGAFPRHAGTKMLVFEDGHFEGTIGGGDIEVHVLREALESLADGKPRLLEYDSSEIAKGNPGTCGGEVTIYVEPYLTPATVVVVGAGHVGRAVAHLAKWMGYRVVISDDRIELCTPEAAPDGDSYLVCPMDQLPKKMTVDSNTYFILVTRDVDIDIKGLPVLLDTEAGYIGLIGSKRRWSHCQDSLLKSGITKEALNRVKSPIGLDIHAESPQEIAVSIMAEVTAVRNEKQP